MKFNSIVEAIKSFAAVSPDKLCLADANGTVAYGKYFRRICGVSAYLLKKGIKPGDRVVAKSSQTIDYLVLCHAVQMIGGVFVPLEKNVAEERINDIIQTTGAVLFVGDITVSRCPCISFKEIAQFEADKEPCALPDTNADSMILFTTGTTGKSKGILLAHSAEVAVAENVKYGVEMKNDNIEIIPMPINHSFGLRRYFGNMINGSTVILLDGVVFINRLFEMLDRYKATSIAMAPAALSIIFKLSGEKIGKYNGQLDYIQFGSAPLPESDKAKLMQLLTDCRLYNEYGSTEAGVSCALNFNSPENRPNCVGKPTCNSRFLVVDENENPMKATRDNPGYLICSGSMRMKGYYKEPELTSSTMKDGYIYSKDLGYIDDEGLIYTLGRADDVINMGGNKIAPGEIEDIARLYPGITDCACVSMNDPLMGQVPKLFIVADMSISTKGLYNYLATKTEKFKLPKAIEFISEIPRTYNGKIWRSKLV